MKQQMTFREAFEGMAGLVFQGGGVDQFIQNIQMAIIMIGSNPFIG